MELHHQPPNSTGMNAVQQNYNQSSIRNRREIKHEWMSVSSETFCSSYELSKMGLMNSHEQCLKRISSIPCRRPVKCGQTVRLMHLQTRKNLHSHHFTSPLSNNFEVSAFGEEGLGDEGGFHSLVFTSIASIAHPIVLTDTPPLDLCNNVRVYSMLLKLIHGVT